MRARHIIVAVLILLGIGAKIASFTVLTAEADSRSRKSVGADIAQVHQSSKDLPVRKSRDVTLALPFFPDMD